MKDEAKPCSDLSDRPTHSEEHDVQHHGVAACKPKTCTDGFFDDLHKLVCRADPWCRLYINAAHDLTEEQKEEQLDILGCAEDALECLRRTFDDMQLELVVLRAVAAEFKLEQIEESQAKYEESQAKYEELLKTHAEVRGELLEHKRQRDWHETRHFESLREATEARARATAAEFKLEQIEESQATAAMMQAQMEHGLRRQVGAAEKAIEALRKQVDDYRTERDRALELADKQLKATKRRVEQLEEVVKQRSELESENSKLRAKIEELEGLLKSAQRGHEDPAARAKRELGEWLVEDQCRAFALAEPHSVRMHWECMLWLEYDRGDGPPSFHARGSTEHEAITAALRVAKGEKS